MTDLLKSKDNLDFDKLSVNRIKDEVEKSKDSKRAYRLDVASDIKELLNDIPSEDRNFIIDTLVTIFLSLD